jgi:hypothetical protein
MPVKKGWIIVDGEVREVRPKTKADREALLGTDLLYEPGIEHEVGHDPDIPTNVVYWTKEAAEEELFRSTEPVEAAWQDLQAGLIDGEGFLRLAGPLEGKKRLARG